MISIHLHKSFEKQFKQIPLKIKEKFLERKNLFLEDNTHPLLNIDTTDELRRQHSLFEIGGYPACRKDPVFWAYLFVRDSAMARNTEAILKQYSAKKNPVVLVFLQSIHWKHVQFLLKNPSTEEIWKYYFGRFRKLTPEILEGLILKRSKLLARYWRRNRHVLP